MTPPARDERRWTLAINEHGSVVGGWAPGVECVEVMPVAAHEAALAAAEHAATFWEDRYNTQHRTLHSAEDEIARLRLALAAARDDEDSAGAECSRLESDILMIHDALVDAGHKGAINADSIVERIVALAAARQVDGAAIKRVCEIAEEAIGRLRRKRSASGFTFPVSNMIADDLEQRLLAALTVGE